jgi:ABC-type Mn2+/Zn2+ transport system permease subunit
LGSAILALVCPLVGAHLILRRRIFLGLTLPQVAACGVAFTFWIYHAAGGSHGVGGERLLAMAGSLIFTLLGMGLLAYLDRHTTGSSEGRLAAAYALASALTILFIVFNPAGELEIVNLLKGEVIALSEEELKLLAVIYGVVFIGLILFRREFLLTSFDRDLAFLLTGGNVQWSFWLYVLCGFSIAVGVIMAGPLLVFGFMVLPPLAARSLARGMGSFFSLSSLLGVLIAIFGFYLSIRWDLPLGPTDVTLGCAVIFFVHAIRSGLRKTRGAIGLWLIVLMTISACSAPAPRLFPNVQALGQDDLWLAAVRNSTSSNLRLPATNPLRSLTEMAKKVDTGYRPTIMDLLRDEIRNELERRTVKFGFPEQRDDRLGAFPFDAAYAATAARQANISGYLLLSDIRRWDSDPHGPLRSWVEFRLVRIDDGTVAWERRIQKVTSSTGARLDQLSFDAVKEIVREVFGT